MKLADRISTSQQSTEVMRVVDGWYEVEEDGYQGSMPVLHYQGRTEHGDYRHVAVDGYRPYFFIAQADADESLLDNVAHDRRVLDVSMAERTGIDRGERNIDLIKITVECPWHVRDLRDEFPRTWEADVLFPQRLLVDRGVTGLMRVPTDVDGPLDATDVEAVDVDTETTDIDPRVVTWDIEVATREALEQAFTDGLVDADPDAFDVAAMPNVNVARRPVTAVSMHDSATDAYATFVLRNSTWNDELVDSDALQTDVRSETETDVDVRVFADERRLLSEVVRWMLRHRPNVITGWNNDGFDAPYMINRYHTLDIAAQLARLSPTGRVDEHDDGGRFINSDITGVHIFDLLAAYEKSQYTELKSSSLEAVSAEETDFEKFGVDEQTAWVTDPVRFTKYVTRDVQATVAINENVNLL